MELWDLYTKDREKANETMARGEKQPIGYYRMVVHVCIFNTKGEMLIQQRQPFKEDWPNRWDITAGGSAIKGDTSQMAAEREVWEEIGLKLNLQDIRPHFTIQFDSGFDDVYLIEKNIRIEELKLQYEEVQQVRWASNEEIRSLIQSGEFIPYYPSFIHLLFDMHKQYGCIPK